MSNKEILRAIQEVLLTARIANVIGTEAEWTASNPVLKRGEMGLVSDIQPLKFKIGDGTNTWAMLGWAQVASLSQLSEDAEHRLVTDSLIAVWNDKAEVFTFDEAVYKLPVTAEAQKQVVRDIVAAVNAGKTPVIIAKVEIPGITAGNTVNGIVPVSGYTATSVVGTISDTYAYRASVSDPVTPMQVVITFKSDGTIEKMAKQQPAMLSAETIVDNMTTDSSSRPLSARQGKILKAAIDNKTVPEYSQVKVATEAGFASTYRLTKDGVPVGVSMNIPLDQVLKSSLIKTVTAVNTPYTGAKVGDKYIEFLFQNNSAPQYLPVQDLVDVYTADGAYIEVSSTNVITLKYDALKTKLQTDLGGAFDPKGAGAQAAEDAIAAFQGKSFVIQCTIPNLNG